jgi:hypothetical protein
MITPTSGGAANLRGGVEPVEMWHRDVHHHDVRLQRLCHLHRGPPVLAPQLLEIRFLFQERAGTLADDTVIVREQNTNHCFSVLILGKFARIMVPAPGDDTTRTRR